MNLLNGFINLDKPYGMSSARAVDRVKKIVEAWQRGNVERGEKHASTPPRATRHRLKIGHAGTLDPLATGVLVLAVGKATKLIHHVQDAPKEYEFTVTWGEERSTDDAEGEVVARSDKRPTLAEIEAILPEFTGDIMQTPPAFSAIKIDGRRAYAMARAGQEVEMKMRAVRVAQLSVISYQLAESPLLTDNCQLTTATFNVACSKGTYVRSLARDFGRKLGVYGYVSMLRRTAVGKFHENDALTLAKLEELVHKGDLDFIKTPSAVLDDILALA